MCICIRDQVAQVELQLELITTLRIKIRELSGVQDSGVIVLDDGHEVDVSQVRFLQILLKKELPRAVEYAERVPELASKHLNARDKETMELFEVCGYALCATLTLLHRIAQVWCGVIDLMETCDRQARHHNRAQPFLDIEWAQKAILRKTTKSFAAEAFQGGVHLIAKVKELCHEIGEVELKDDLCDRIQVVQLASAQQSHTL
ncbi:hypothetical protein CC1G_12710 [Coprinopsis cinerea okayama7|uniref:Uncharacterized protein n=1 Tax=Coprinopsis cinerea (strain Okayama-7 / 130 / ATCC MYA-4618 / FGSC 9003) TaxID=240176 RepID=A8PGY0_COPC7|nr:hypothetical protein CC1G_12710 [Coprinopsis cinerea okayama7\|eukprot:XP_001841303.1 hypothetical protein CC1G_12710 [Coprinopsis cinerea okayama7\